MKNRSRLPILICALAFVPVLFASPVAADEDIHEARSAHYRVLSEVSEQHAVETSERLEALLRLYNQHFRFPVEELEHPLHVRVFASSTRFDRYLRRLTDERRRGFAYLHYGDPVKNELVGYVGDSEALESSFVHQSFIQFLRTFIANPPLWIREGFAIHFENTRYDTEFGAVLYRENLGWLDALQEIIAEETRPHPMPLEEILALSPANARENLEVFYPQAWGMVNFLINSSRPETNRILWDSLSALAPSATMAENQRNVYDRAFRWINRQDLEQEFVEYVMGRRTFRGWVEYGVSSFEEGDLETAERAFIQANAIRDNHHVPNYFLGLINYERGNYSLADYYYRESREYGAEEATTLYALGVNAFADNRFEDARRYLEMAIEKDRAFLERAEEVLMRIGG